MVLCPGPGPGSRHGHRDGRTRSCVLTLPVDLQSLLTCEACRLSSSARSPARARGVQVPNGKTPCHDLEESPGDSDLRNRFECGL
eukprot:2489926-Rhodomonas_salina.3